MLMADSDRRAAMGEASRNIAARHDIGDTLARYAELYAEVASQGRGTGRQNARRQVRDRRKSEEALPASSAQ
jgi:hypothetical protein